MGILILLATMMAIFGVVGYLRGARSSFVTALTIWLLLVLLERMGGKASSLINGLNFGIRFVLAGGLQALGGGSNTTESVDDVIRRMGTVPPIVSSNSSAVSLIIILLLATAVAFVIGGWGRFRGKPSGWGLAWGLLSGYMVSAYLLGPLAAENGIALPLPLGVSGIGGPAAAAPSVAPTSGTGLVDRFMQLVTANAIDSTTLALAIVIGIAAFVIFATRFTNRSTKKG